AHRALAELPRRAHVPAAGIALVHHAIAIVVDAVADLHRRLNVGHARERSALAKGNARAARTGQARHAHHPRARRAIVDDAIAIVIEPIAYLGRRVVGGADRHRVAGRYRDLASPDAARNLGKTVVYRSIAIVIDRVTRLKRREHVARAIAPDAILHANLITVL